MRKSPRLAASTLVLLTALAACTSAAGPSSSRDAAPAVAPRPAAAAPPAARAPAAVPVPAAAPGPAANPAAAPSAPTSAPAAAAPDPAPLPQTRDCPAAIGPGFEARARVLWDAVVADDAERGLPAFFPLGAYRQVKAVADPARDWNRRLVAAYRRDLHALHLQLGRRAAEARFVGLVVPEKRARWVEPGEEWNKLGYWRVFGSRLEYELDGRRRSFPVTSLISWRGEWYVVHLSKFK
jgi:hypothetical protein